jgi:hypothetical protein
MGTWGYGPFDNDDAGDMVAKLARPVKLVASGKGNTGGDYYLARATVQFLLASHATDILGGPALEPALRALARMRMDRELLACWGQPKSVAVALNGEIADVFDRMRACRGCRRSIKVSVWRELEALVVQARGFPVPRSLTKKGRRAARAIHAAARARLRKGRG